MMRAVVGWSSEPSVTVDEGLANTGKHFDLLKYESVALFENSGRLLKNPLVRSLCENSATSASL